MKKVAVIILNYKVKIQTMKCIESVQKSNYENIQIYVIDNNSGDGIGEEIEKIKSVSFVQNKENAGYSGGNNLGIKKAIEDGVDYMFILNPDTTVDKDAIEFLVSAVDSEDVGISGPKIFFSTPDGSEKIWYAGGVFDKDNVIGKHRGVDEQDHGQYEQKEETGFVSGAAMMVKKEVFEKIGFFDENYFLYYEDSDFCFRAKQAGFKIMYEPRAIVYHENAKSTGLGSNLQDYFITRNRMLFASKFLPFRTRFALFREAIRNINNPTRRLAFGDFLLGKFGKGSFLK